MSNRFESIVKHLLEMEENTEDLITSLASSSGERRKLSELMKTYIHQVEAILSKKEEIDYDQFPMIIVGCRVGLEEIGSDNLIEYKIVSPFCKEYDVGSVSCVSPVGKEMLLRKVGDEFSVTVPLGELRYRIVSIIYE